MTSEPAGDEPAGDVRSGDGPLDRLRARLAGAALFVDFDGTLAPIVRRPADARPLPRAVDALVDLAGRCPLVAVVSGRPIAFLDPWFPAGIRLAGLYGLEGRVDGRVELHPASGRWRPIVAEAVKRAQHLPPTVGVEDKGLSLTLHFRDVPELAAVVAEWARAYGVSSGLQSRAAKMSIELHPPVEVDKGSVVETWASAVGAEAAFFAGDDAGDLPAFAALARLRARGAVTCGLAVVSAETPSALLAAADGELDGPAGLADLLADLAAAPGRRTAP